MNLELQDETIDKVVVASTGRKQLYVIVTFSGNSLNFWEFFLDNTDDRKRLVTLMEYTQSLTLDELIGKQVHLVMNNYQIYGIAHPKKNKFFQVNSISFEEITFK